MSEDTNKTNNLSNLNVSAHQKQFNNCLVEFIDKLRKILPPDLKRPIIKYYNYYRTFLEDQNQNQNQNRNDDKNKIKKINKSKTSKSEEFEKTRIGFIREFIHYISRYNKEISICDEGLFSEEPEYYPGKPIQLFKGIDFKLIWRAESVNDKTKESIWKYLQTLYVLATYVLKETEKFNGLLKEQQDIIYNIMQGLKMEQKIKDDAEKLNEEERKKAAESSFDFSNLQDLFGENNMITEMAMEIAKELNLPNEKLSDPLEAIQLLFGQNGSKLQEIIAKVSHKLHEKMQNSGISEEQLLNDAKKMNEKLVGKFKNIPGMPDIEQFSKKVAEQISKEIDNKKTNNPDGQPTDRPTDQLNNLPSINDLTASLSQNLSQLGFDNLDQFQKNFSNIMSEINHRQQIPEPDTQLEPNSPLIDPVQDQELQRELDELKKNINK